MSVGFIYPAWLAAKSRLIDALYERKRDSDIYEIVDAWMKKHFFEVGVSVNVDMVQLYKHEEEMERHLRHMAARKLADEVLSKDLYVRKMIAHNPPNQYGHFVPERTYSYTIIIGGVPLLTGPGTREAKILEIERTKVEDTQ